MSEDLSIGSNHKHQKLRIDIDNLSNLPDSIIAHILSFLPTKNAVATTLLSSRFKSIWKNITILKFIDFDHSGDTYFGKSRRNNHFARFVNRVLLILNSKRIEKFILEIEEYDRQYDISTWIETVIAMNVRVITICICRNDVSNKHRIYLPACVYTSRSLEEIYLFGVMSLNVPKHVCLPNLEKLCFRQVCYGCDESVKRLVSGCPSLHSMNVIRDLYDDVVVFTISCPTLRDLTFMFLPELKLEEVGQMVPGESYYRVELDARSLRSLMLMDDFSRDFSVSNMSSLDKAVLRLSNACHGTDSRTSYINAVVKLLQTTSNVKNLSLSGEVFEVLSHEGFSLSYSRLTSLEVSCCTWSPLLNFLDWSKELEEVRFFMEKCLPLEQTWGSVPVSLSTSLKTMTVGVFEGLDGELALLAHVLEKAQVLRKAKIVISSFLDDESKSWLIEEISEFCLGSKDCEITFEDEDGHEGKSEAHDDDEDDDED